MSELAPKDLQMPFVRWRTRSWTTRTRRVGCCSAVALALPLVLFHAGSVVTSGASFATSETRPGTGNPLRSLRDGRTDGSLESLVSAAEVIFIGRVREVVDGQIPLKGAVSMPGRVITFDVIDVLQGQIARPYVLTVPTRLKLDPPLGEEVLWYLGPVSAGSRHRVPLGVSLGYFRIIKGERGKLVVRQGGNKGLWASDKPLWEDPSEASVAKDYLMSMRHLDDPTASAVVAIGYEPCCSDVLPLDFVLAATHLKLPPSSSLPRY